MLNIAALPVIVIVVFSLLDVCALAVVALYIQVLVYFSRQLPDWRPRYRARFVLAVYPVLEIL